MKFCAGKLDIRVQCGWVVRTLCSQRDQKSR